jgi:two-component system, NtrC family, response regulator HydG
MVEFEPDSRILIVDDEESLRLTFKMFLSREGYGPISVAATYEEAESLIERESFDLVISDIVMEGASGMDLLRRIKESGLKCPVIMVTGYPNINTAAQAVRLGAFDYLAKPVKKNDLLRVSRMALQQHALSKEMGRLRAEKEHYRQYLETIFRSVRDAIITVDQGTKIIQMNQTARDWTGNIAGFQVGSRLSELPGSFGITCLRDVEYVLNQKKEVREHRAECNLDGGEQVVLRISAAPLEDHTGDFLGVVLVLRDVTRLESLEQQGKRSKFHRLIGASQPMQTTYTLIEHVGRVDTAVLITGESGTGKELVAEALHAESPRRGMPLIKVDCTAIPETLLESELFGHAKGSFTGADRERKGRILQADGGTLFLDEIGDIPQLMQLRLLRFLQEKTFYPVGKDKPLTVDVRVIAATNADLRRKVDEGAFREDLYYRLRVVDIVLPPLRERIEDLPQLIEFFLERFSKRLGKEISGITDQALVQLSAYHWPGNVRELEHVLERASVLCPGTITTAHLPLELTAGSPEPAANIDRPAAGQRETEQFIGSENEKERIFQALRQTDGNKAKAARLLGFDRSTLYRKLRFYSIDDVQPERSLTIDFQ